MSENNTQARRERLNNTLLFTNRPILPNEVVQFLIEEVSTEFYGLIRFGLTTINPASFTSNSLPKAMPASDQKDWLVPSPRGVPTLQRNTIIRIKYTAEGEILLDYEGRGLQKSLVVSPINQDIWCALDLNGVVSQIRLVQNESLALPTAVERSRRRFLQYTNNRQDENRSIYYSEITPSTVTMKNCDENCEISENIAVKKTPTASVTVDSNLVRCMYAVIQILDMDHTLSNYFTVRCLTNDRSSDEHSKLIDLSYDHLTLGDEICVRVTKDGTLTLSVNNRTVKSLFRIDLTVNDNSQVTPTSYRLDFLLNGRVTGIRLIGIYLPTSEESRAPPVVGGGCLATIIHRVCPNRLNGLLLPCQHLCVCFECGKALQNRHSCPYPQCRKSVAGCIKVYRD